MDGMTDIITRNTGTDEGLNDAETQTETQTETPSQIIYCGPNIPSKGIFTYQVYLGGLPYNVREMIETVPEIEKLIVPVSECDLLRARISEKGTIENLYYERVKGKVIK